MHNSNEQQKQSFEKSDFYNTLTNEEISIFTETFSTFQDVILSMIRNAVRVLPKDKINLKPSIKAHLNVNSTTKHNQEYENFIDIKQVFISCLPNEEQKIIYNNAIKYFTINKEKKIKFVISKKFYTPLQENSKLFFRKDIKKLEEIINKINDNFNRLLPEAKKQGQLLISKIRRVEIPDKAKYTEKKQEKGQSR